MTQVWSERAGFWSAVLDRADRCPSGCRVAGLCRGGSRLAHGRNLKRIGPQSAVDERALRAVAVIAAPSDASNFDGAVEINAGKRIGIGGPADAICRNPAVSVSVKAVGKIGRDVKRN